MFQNKLILGTAQIGMNYGVNNASGKISKEETFRILDFAVSKGINKIETAEDYGDALGIIGEYHKYKGRHFDIILKSNLNKDLNLNIKERIQKFTKLLSINKLNSFFFHSYDSLKRNEKALDDLIFLKNAGEIEKIGVSIYNNEELESSLLYDDLDIIQIPFNLLDNYSKRGRLIELAKKKNKTIHVRSAFLQGLFFMDNMSLPEHYKPLIPYLEKIDDICNDFNLTVNELAIGYVNSFNNIEGIIIGLDKKDHLVETIKSMNNKISTAIIKKINNIQTSDDFLLNPMNWK